MIKFIACCLFFCYLISPALYSQSDANTNQEKITAALNDYFKMDRENIHLHLNKNSFLTDEAIWFKGYIIEKKTNTPYTATSNVYIALLDGNGEKIQTQLFFAENSVFDGTINLSSKLATGKYYLQVYTNYMNNFTEDESSIYEITIINPSENNYVDTKIINYKNLEIQFYPESGTFLEGVSNTIAAKIVDCNNNGVLVKNAEIVDSKGYAVTTFSTNQFGYGRFDILYTNNEVYKAILDIKGEKIEKYLPSTSLEGISYSINNYTFKDKTTIKLKTNTRTLKEIKKIPHTLVIQHNEAVSYIPIVFAENETEHAINLSSEKIVEGLNTFHLINSKGEKIGERIIYKPFQIKDNVELAVVQKRNDSIVISGKSSMVLSNLSISVLPYQTVSEIPEKSIYSALQFDNSLSGSSKNMAYYLNDFNRTKHYELDNFLLTQKSKYNWDAMLKNPPQKKYDFDSGLTIKGTVNNALTAGETYNIKVNSLLLGLDQTTALNAKNEFLFENVFAIDSAAVHFSLMNRKLKPMELKLYCQILCNNRKFLKPFLILKKDCIQITKNLISDNSLFPVIKNAILLDSINIIAKKKKDVLANTLKFNNSAAKGYKITENVASSFGDVLGFIRMHGYNVTIEGASVYITRTFSNSFSGNLSPVVYIDDIPQSDFSLLLNYSLSSVDEIYVNKMGYGEGMTAPNGTIRIYSKTPGSYGKDYVKIKSKPFVVTNGFQRVTPYENPKYGNMADESFLKFGTIQWNPNVETDSEGLFRFSIPNLYQKTVKVVIEGISSDGRLISVTKTLLIEE
jgi:hypothetical protein